MVWAVASGRGSRLAREDAPRQEAALRALQPLAVPEAKNAAVLWLQAGKAVVPWRDLEPPTPDADEDDLLKKDPAALSRKDLQLPATFADGAPIHRWLAANQTALDLAVRAARMESCAWNIDWATGLLGANANQDLYKPRDAARLVCRHAAVAASQHHWQAVEDDVRLLLVLAQHQSRGPGFMSYLLSNATVGMAVGTIQDALVVPGSRPDPIVVERLAALAREQAGLTPDVRPYMPFERHGALQVMARLGGGDVSWMPSPGSGAFGFPLAEAPIPSALNLYAPLYPLDRSFLEEVHDSWQTDLIGSGVQERLRSGYSKTGACIITAMVTPGVSVLYRSGREIPWRWRIAQVALTIEVWANTHANAWPARLEDLGLDSALLTDPWQPTKSLRMLVLEDGGLDCWSVGKNGRDDTHGDDEKTVGYKPTPDDIVFHLASRRAGP